MSDRRDLRVRVRAGRCRGLGNPTNSRRDWPVRSSHQEQLKGSRDVKAKIHPRAHTGPAQSASVCRKARAGSASADAACNKPAAADYLALPMRETTADHVSSLLAATDVRVSPAWIVASAPEAVMPARAIDSDSTRASRVQSCTKRTQQSLCRRVECGITLYG
jgi:hypothetical protein